MGCRLSSRSQQQPELTTPSTHGLINNALSSTNFERAGHEQGNKETHGPGDEPEDVASSPDPATHADKNGPEMVITCIRASDLTLGLRRLPAGFYVIVHHSGFEWRTENKPVSVNSDVVEWSGPIPIPSGLSASVTLAVHASFEFQPMLGNGEQLRELTITVERLLGHSAKSPPFIFPTDGDVVSPCSSLLVTVRRRDHESDDSSPLGVLEPYCSATEPRSLLEETTSKGHNALSRYRRHEGQRDLKYAIEQFDHALNICPLDHACYAVAQSNMAMAKLIHYRAYDSDGSIDVPLTLYRNTLAARPVGHPDRPSTLIQLATVHLARFEKLRDEADVAQAEAFLYEVISLCSVESHENRAATFMLQLRAGHPTGPVVVDDRSSVEQGSDSGSTVMDLRESSLQLLRQFKRFGDLADLEKSISYLEASMKSISVVDPWYVVGLTNLGVALSCRFDRLGELTDLEETISRQYDAVDLTPDGHSDKPHRLNNLGTSLKARFDRLGGISDLEEAISRQRNAVDLTPDSHPDKPMYLINLGNSFLVRFMRFGEIINLEEAISRQRNAVELTPDGHPDKPVYLTNLGNSFLVRFMRLGEIIDLEEAISRQRDAVDLTPDGHPDKPMHLNNLGTSLKARFDRFGELRDLEDALSRQRDAVDLTPNDHPDKPTHLNNLGTLLNARFDRFGEKNDMEEAISRQQDAVDLTPDGHPNKPQRLNNLGNSFKIRFERFGDIIDLGEAISRQRNAVNLTPDGHPDKPTRLTNLGNFSLIRFMRLGEIIDLEEAISRQRDAVELTPDDHPDKPIHLNNLCASLKARFDHFGEIRDLENAISRQRDAVDLTPDGHPNKPQRPNNLGMSLKAHFDRFGETNHLKEAISRQRDAVNLTPDGHPDKPQYLNGLGNFFLIRFDHFGERRDLEDAMSQQRDAVELTPDGHPDKPQHLNNLGNCFRIRFEHFGEIIDLDEAIWRQRDAVDLTPDGHSDKPMRLTNLGNSYLIRFMRFGEIIDLEEAISRQRGAVELTPDDHPIKPLCLTSVSNSFLIRFMRFGKIVDLEEAVSGQRDAVDLTPDGHPDKPKCLTNLGNSFLIRFERLGEISDLAEAISRQRDAVDLTPDGHSDKPMRLTNLGNSFLIRFVRLGEIVDLEEAISRQRDAVELTPDGHPDKSMRLNNLGASLLARFDRFGETSDMEEAISRQRDADDLTPEGHPDKPQRLNNLGMSLKARFDRFGEISDLEDAISRQQDAVDLTPDGHPDKPMRLNNLGNTFRIRFERFGDIVDLEEAISKQRDAVKLTPNGHPDKPRCLNNLGTSLSARFDRFGEISDLEEVISRLRDAVVLTPDGHPDKPQRLNGLGMSLLMNFERLGEQSDLEEAILSYSHAACSPVGPIAIRFHASRQWISCALLLRHDSVLSAYSVAIHLLPQLAWIGLSLAHRYRELIQGSDVVREAAAAALDSGRPETAVEWLEQGRSIVWGELFQLRSSYDELSSAHPDHARRLRELSAALEQASSSREKSFYSQMHSTELRVTESLQQEADRHRTLAIERDKLLQDIRALPGFERFLLHKKFSQLRASAHSGPVVILNAAESRCDALIVLSDVDHVIHVPLPNFTLGRSKDFQTSLMSFVRHTRDVTDDDRYGQPVPQEDPGRWKPILSPLWKCVAKPVLDALAISTPGDPPRIFWCPTGPFTFLPIHAAGFYDSRFSEPGHKVFDFVVSSYVPTLSILATSPKSEAPSHDDLRLLAVRQPLSDGQSKLPGVVAELEYINTIIRNSPSARATLTESSAGTVEEVLALMKESDWVHFACHGVQDAMNPTDSGLCLADKRRLRVSDLIALSRPRGGLAFLSACQTAMGDEDLSDEAIHIAAAMLFAGYGGVVGTLWSISDKLAPGVAKDVYEQLFRNGTTPDHREAARALHVAVGRLRDSNVPFHDWLPFVHVGL